MTLTSEIDGLPNIFDGPLGVYRGDDFKLARGRLVGGEHSDLAPGHLLLVNHDRLQTQEALVILAGMTGAPGKHQTGSRALLVRVGPIIQLGI